MLDDTFSYEETIFVLQVSLKSFYPLLSYPVISVIKIFPVATDYFTQVSIILSINFSFAVLRRALDIEIMSCFKEKLIQSR